MYIAISWNAHVQYTYTSVSDTDKQNWYVLLLSKNLVEHTLYTLADCSINTMPIVQRLSLNGGHLQISYVTKRAPLWYASHVSLSKAITVVQKP